MNDPRQFTLSRRILLGWLCFLAANPAALLAQVSWDSNNNGANNERWNNNKNWSADILPGPTDTVQFNSTAGTVATVGTNVLFVDVSVGALTFNNVDDTFSILDGTSGAHTLTLSSGNITRTAGSSGTQTLDFTNLALGANSTMNIAGSGSLVINAIVQDSGGARSVNKTGAGELVLSGANTFSGNIAVNAGTLRVQNTKANVDAFLTDARLKATSGSGGTLVLAYTAGGNRTLGPAANLATASAVVLGLESNGGTFTLGTAGGGTGDLANWGGLQVGPATTVTFADNNVFNPTDSLTLLGGTLNLNNTIQTFGTLTVSANSTIDFAGTSSTLNLSNLVIAAGIKLTVTNWTNAADFFYTTGWAGASFDTTGAPMNQVVFTGYGDGSSTHWREFNHEITPVPEPSTYGVLMMFGASGIVAYRRRERRA